MINLETVVQQIGLSENEAKTYIAALETGETAITTLAKKANLKRPTVYLAVSRLEMLGLVSRIKKEKKNLVSPVHPRRLLQIAKLREKDVEDNFPKLLGLYQDTSNKPTVQMFEGKEAVMHVYRDMYESMEEGNEALWFTKIDTVKEGFDEILEEYKRKLKKMKKPLARELALDTEAGRQWAKEVNEALGTNTHTRLLPKDTPLGDNEILIIENKVAFFTPGKEIFVIVIENAPLAKTMRAVYELAWSLGKSL